MTKLQTIVFSVAAVAGISIVWWTQHEARTKLTEENRALRQRIEQLSRLEQANDQLSNMVAVAEGSQAAVKEQLNELLKLRGEVGSLRRVTNELGQVKADNQRLKASLASAGGQNTTGELEPSSGGLPRESWAFAGYRDPDSALQTTLWAMSQGNAKLILASLTPDGPQYKEISGQTEEEVSTKSKAEFDKVTAFKIIDREVLSNDEVILVAYAYGMNESARIKLQRLDNEWKVAGPVKDMKPRTTQ
jgi:hypothetical protein